jgi:ATP-dependent DNA helicase RecG
MVEHAISDEVAEVIERFLGEETLDWEVKAARGGLPNAIWETVSAFSNTDGGWLILGIAEHEGTKIIEGVADPHAMVQQIHELMRNRSKISQPVCGPADVTVVDAKGRQLVAVRVPPAARRVRPIYTRDNPYAGTYVRRHEGDFPATRPEVDRMMREAGDVSADQIILPGYSLADVDAPSLQRYRRRYQTANPDSPHNARDDETFLAAIGGFRRERETGRSGVTVAGLLMFGTDEAIRSWRGRHMIDFRLVEHDPGDWIHRETWEGNLLGAYEKLMPLLLDGLPIPLGFEDGVRVDQSDRHKAVREVFVNLLVHADYTERATSLIVRFPSGYRFRNPGTSRVAEIDAAVGDRSDPRNPELVRMFRLIGLAEEAGTGIPRVNQAWRRLGYEPPAFESDAERYEFQAGLTFQHLLSDDDLHWLAGFGEEFGEEEQLALVIARHEGDVDNATLRSVTGQHPVDITRMLGKLRDAGYLRMVGIRRGARYVLGRLALDDEASGPDIARLGPIFEGLPPNSVDSESGIGDLAGSIGDSAGTMGDLAGSIGDSAGTIGDSDVLARLNAIAAPVHTSGRVPGALLIGVIVDLCAEAELSTQEIAGCLDRDRNYVSKILTQMVREGHLLARYPDQPRHPQQRYRAGKTNRQPLA